MGLAEPLFPDEPQQAKTRRMKYRFIDLCGVPDAINSRKCNAPREPAHRSVAAPVKKTAPPPHRERGSKWQGKTVPYLHSKALNGLGTLH